MTRYLLKITRILILLGITVMATGVMWWVSRPGDEASVLAAAGNTASAPLIATPKALVYATPVEPKLCDITVRYSGKIRPWETYTLGFEIPGRVSQLGQNELGRELDDGDRVEAGQMIARLDDRILRAQQSEAVAQYELAESDLQRSRRVREISPGALADADFQNDLTQVALAKARQEIAFKNLEDAVLLSPISGAIVRRMVEVGESVNPHATIFEVVENDKLRLVVNVPEARVRELELRRRAVKQAQAEGKTGPEATFIAHVRLEGADVYGNPWPTIDAEVYHIAEIADSITGLFEVEVLIPNEEGLLRPGMVATADLVTDRIMAYETPESSVLFRPGETYLFTVEPKEAPMQVMFWELGQAEVLRARRIELSEWVDQGEVVLLPADKYSLSGIVTRGQQRLRDGQLVRISEPSQPKSDQTEEVSVAAKPQS